MTWHLIQAQRCAEEPLIRQATGQDATSLKTLVIAAAVALAGGSAQTVGTYAATKYPGDGARRSRFKDRPR